MPGEVVEEGEEDLLDERGPGDEGKAHELTDTHRRGKSSLHVLLAAAKETERVQAEAERKAHLLELQEKKKKQGSGSSVGMVVFLLLLAAVVAIGVVVLTSGGGLEMIQSWFHDARGIVRDTRGVDEDEF